MKKLLSIVLIMLLISVLTFVLAEDEPTVYTCGDYKYILLANGTAEITDYNPIYVISQTIPTTLDGHIVTAIGDSAFYKCCDYLTTISIPDTVTTIGDLAFSYCESLTTISIPNSVTAIGQNPFSGCEKLTKIIISPDHPVLALIDGALFDKTEKKLIFYPIAYRDKSYAIPQGIRIIGDSAFSHSFYLTSISIPDSVTTIGDYTFNYCWHLSTISIPDSVTSIGENAFRDCNSLTTISIPDGVTTIGDEAFSDCLYLETISIPNSVTTIGKNPFKNSRKLTNIIISPDHPVLALIDGALFDKTEKKLISSPLRFRIGDYAIPQDVRIIGKEAFYDCNLSTISIPDGVTTIEDGAFSFCSYLTTISIPNSVTTIGDSAFSLCTSLTTISIPDSVTTIGDSAFSSCWSLSTISIPDSVTSIGESAFFGCESLTTFSIPDSVTTIGDRAFFKCDTLNPITVIRNSYAEQYCKENGLRFTYPDANDWLLN